MDITKLIEKIRKFRDERERKQFHNPKDLAQAISIEAAELMEPFLWNSSEESYKIASKQEVHEEFADTFNYLLLFADAANIDIEKVVLEKLKKNEKKYPVDKVKGKSDKYTTYIELKNKN